jgi:hypothetical protein
MDLRILGLLVLLLIVVSGGAVIPFLTVSAVLYLLALLAHVAMAAWSKGAADDDRAGP